MESRQSTVYACFYLKYHQINVNQRDFKRDWMKSRKRCLIFSILMTIQVLLNLGLMEPRQSTVYACFYMKYHQINVNQRDFKRDWMKSRKKCLIFSILMTIQVLLNLV